MSLGESIRKGTTWLITGNVTGRLLQFAFGVVLARLLAPADFGMLVTMHIFTGLAGFVAGGGMGQALIRAKEVEPRHFHVVFTLQFSICLSIYGFFYAISPWFATWYDTPLYEDLLRVSALSFLLRPLASVQRARLQREMRFKAVAIIGFCSSLIGGGASIAMALDGMGVWSLVLGGLIGAAASNLLLVVTVRQTLRPAFDWQIARTLGGYGLKVQTNDILVYLKSQTANLVLSRLAGPAPLGLYNKADSLNQMPRATILGATYQTVFRALAKTQDNLDLSKYIYYRTITLVCVYTLPLYVGIWWLAEPFIRVVYGEKWIDSAAPLQVLALAGLCFCISPPAGALLAAQNRLGSEMVLHLISWALTFIAVVIGLEWGLPGVAWGIVLVHLYVAVHISVLVMRILRSRIADLTKALAPALALNGLLFVTLGAADGLLPEGMRANEPAVYLLCMAIVGALAYAAAFLFIPVAALAAESDRWKKTLGLTRS